MTLGQALAFVFTMFSFGWISCWLCTFNLYNGNVRQWLGGHVHPRRRIEFIEFQEIRNEGFNDAVDAAAGLLEKFAAISNDGKETLRHAALIRKLRQVSKDSSLAEKR